MVNILNGKLKISHLANTLFFISLGFNFLALYLPLIIIHVFFNAKEFFNFKIAKSYFILLSLLFFSLFFSFFIGYENLYGGFRYQVATVLAINIFYAGYILQKLDASQQIKMVFFYIVGVWAKSSLIVIYSFLTDPILYGYGKLLDPLIDIELNSPAISNSISLCVTAFLLILIIQPLSKVTKISLYFCVAVSILCGIFLGGRTFFIIVFFGVIFAAYYKRDLEFFIKVFVISVVGAITIFSNDLLFDKLNFLVSRFDSGLASSSRFEHYLSALQRIPYYPLGGFKVDNAIENTHWFHNLFFDIASIGGWIPLIGFIFYFTYVVLGYFFRKTKDNNNIIGFCLFCLCLFVMMQDVILDGNYQILIISFFSGLLALNSKKVQVSR